MMAVEDQQSHIQDVYVYTESVMVISAIELEWWTELLAKLIPVQCTIASLPQYTMHPILW